MTVIVGGSSPFSKGGALVYQLLAEAAKERGLCFDLIDFVGVGQEPEFGLGLRLSTSVDRAIARLGHTSLRGMLLCRCYGCLVGARLLAKHPKAMRRFDEVVFWAPTRLRTMRDLLRSFGGTIESYNRLKGLASGYSYHPEFFDEGEDLPDLVARFPSNKRYRFACGDQDELCRPEEVEELAAILRARTSLEAEEKVISGAGHSVRPGDCPSVVEAYLAYVFRDAPLA